MYTNKSSGLLAGLVLFLNISILHASSVPARRQSSTCPSVWTDVATNLTGTFAGCSDNARAAIRTSFHDCFPGACDGSLILASECTDRGENSQMIGICSTLGSIATAFDVSTADTIQLAAALGIAVCSGPAISFKVGRTDSSTANPAGQMPGANDNATSTVAAFAAKGFDATELVALVGAHTAAKNLGGTALDTTVSAWDNTFYADTLDGNAPASIGSDLSLSTSAGTNETWEQYANSASDWQAAFVPAMEKMSLLGNDESTLTDCSSLITAAVAAARRRV